jgi:hypothetical protein
MFATHIHRTFTAKHEREKAQAREFHGIGPLPHRNGVAAIILGDYKAARQCQTEQGKEGKDQTHGPIIGILVTKQQGAEGCD